MKRVINGNFIVAGLLLTAAYFAAANFMPMPLLMVLLSGAAIGITALVIAVYAPLFWQSTRNMKNRVAVLAIGMGLLWASFFGTRITSAVYRALGLSDRLLDNQLIGFFVYMGVIGAIFHVAAPGYPAEGFREKFGGRYRWLILGALVGGAVLAVLLTVAGIRL